MLKINQLGIAPLLIIIIVTALIGLSTIALDKFQHPKQNPTSSNNQISSSSASLTTAPSASPTLKPTTKSVASIKTLLPTLSPTPKPSASSPATTTNGSSGSTPTPTPTPTPGQSSISIDGGDCVSGNVVSLKLDYKIANQTSGSLWGSVTDGKSGDKIIFLYIKGVAAGPGSGTFGNTIGSIRSSNSMPVVGDGRIYTFRLFDAPDTTGLPTSDGTTVTSTTFSKTCPSTPSPDNSTVKTY